MGERADSWLAKANPDVSMERATATGWYTVEQREQALLAMVLQGGRVMDTAVSLGIPRETLKSWKKRYAERYEELQRKHGHEIEARAVAGLQAFIVRAEEAKAIALDKTVQDLEADQEDERQAREAIARGEEYKGLPGGRIKSPDNALKNIAIAQGISVQKILELTQRPTQIVQHNSIEGAVAALRALGGVVDTGYDASTTAEVVPSMPELPAGEPTQSVADAETSDS